MRSYKFVHVLNLISKRCWVFLTVFISYGLRLLLVITSYKFVHVLRVISKRCWVSLTVLVYSELQRSWVFLTARSWVSLTNIFLRNRGRCASGNSVIIIASVGQRFISNSRESVASHGMWTDS